jgi:LysM repeat protein
MKMLTPAITIVALLSGCTHISRDAKREESKAHEKLKSLEQTVAINQRIMLDLADHILAERGEYVVRPGDTGLKIAKQFGMDLRDLAEMNPGVAWHLLKVGQVIRIKNPPNQRLQTMRFMLPMNAIAQGPHV